MKIQQIAMIQKKLKKILAIVHSNKFNNKNKIGKLNYNGFRKP